MRNRRRVVVGSTSWCYICGLPIPDQIVTPTHPLFGTVDHVVPISKGGKHKLTNLRAAHFMCNQRKGPHDKLRTQQRIDLFCSVVGVLHSYGWKPTKAHLKIARERAGIPDFPISRSEYDRERHREIGSYWCRSFSQWEDDGGAVRP